MPHGVEHNEREGLPYPKSEYKRLGIPVSTDSAPYDTPVSIYEYIHTTDTTIRLTDGNERRPHVDGQQVDVVVGQQLARAAGRREHGQRAVRDAREQQRRQCAQWDAAGRAL